MWNQLQQRRSQIGPLEFEQEKQRILSQAEGAFEKCKESAVFYCYDSYLNVVHTRGVRVHELRSELLERTSGKDSFKALYGLGKLNFMDGEASGSETYFREAIRYFEQAENIDRSQKLLFFNYGYALDKIRDPARAIEKYREAIRIDPIFTSANINIGLAYMRVNNFAAAINSFNDVFRLDPNNFTANLNIAKIYIQTGQKQQARQHLSTALSASPGNQEAMYLMQLASTGS
jgi:tetratricopeptide (TPR) repeat protein